MNESLRPVVPMAHGRTGACGGSLFRGNWLAELIFECSVSTFGRAFARRRADVLQASADKTTQRAANGYAPRASRKNARLAVAMRCLANCVILDTKIGFRVDVGVRHVMHLSESVSLDMHSVCRSAVVRLL